MSTPRALVVNKMHTNLAQKMLEIGWTVDYRPDISREEILQILRNYEGLIVRSKTAVDEELIQAGPALRFVARAGAGLDQIDLGALDRHHIELINAPEGNRDSLGEHTVGMLLMLLHKLRIASNEVSAGKWRREPNRGLELKGKTIGIFGYGYMGSAFAEKLRGFECEVIAYDKFKEDFGGKHIREVDLETFQQETEVLSIHVPLTSNTRHYFDLDVLRKYPRLQFLLNTARGEVLNLSDVLTLLDEGKLLGVALDVLENEQINHLTEPEQAVFDQLRQHPQVVITPHIAGWTSESYARINQVIVDKIIDRGLATRRKESFKN